MKPKEIRRPSSHAVILLTGAVMALAGCAVQQPALPAALNQKIAYASSRGDHESIAAQYEHQATADAATARRHQGYASTYRKNTSQRSGVEAHAALANHCDNLARSYQAAAAENLAMARLHRELAIPR